MAMTPLPTPPSSKDPANFDDRADELLAVALPQFVEEANDLAEDVSTKQGTASAAAVTATEQAGIATTKAGEAGDHASDALGSRVAAENNAGFAYEHMQNAEAAAIQANASKVAAAESAATIDPQALSSGYAGPDEPPVIWAWMIWADTGNMRRKQRNAANTAWVDIGPLLVEMAAKSDLTPEADLQWLGTPIGGYITPHLPPPKDDPRFRYVLCTAGESGAGGYNEGVLTNESVTGSGPLIIANADISLAGSLMDGINIPLVNTDSRFIGAGEVEALENDSFQNITGEVIAWSSSYGLLRTGESGLTSGAFKKGTALSNGLGTGAATASSGIAFDASLSENARTSDHTQPKTLRKIHYQRIL